MQPLQYDLRSPAAKDNSITHAAKAGSNLDAATAMRSAKTELQTAIPFTLRERSYSCKAEWNNGIPSATHPPAPLAMQFALRERSYSCKSQWNSIGNSCTSTTCNPIYIAGTILQLQITMEFCRPHMHEKQVKPHLQCGTDPNMIRP